MFQVDLVFILNYVDIASYKDNNTSYVVAVNTIGVIISLEKSCKALFEWFKNNLFKN